MNAVILLLTCVAVLDAAVYYSDLTYYPNRQHFLKKNGLWEKAMAARTSEALTSGYQSFIDYQDEYYLTNITIGTPPQKFTILPDTGSANLWVISVNCTAPQCTGNTEKSFYTKNQYNSSESVTFTNIGGKFKLTYGSGSCIGYFGVDTVSVGDFSYPAQTFGIATHIAAVFGDQPLDGIMGLGWQSIAVDNVVPVVPNLLPQFRKPVFTVYMSGYSGALGSDQPVNGGRITYGDYDTVNCKSEINWVLLSSQTYWQFTTHGFSVGSFKSKDWYQAISDTGTALIAFPHYYFVQTVREIGANFDKSEATVNCSAINKLPHLVINIGGHSYGIPPTQYILKTPGLDEQCRFGGFDNGSPGFAPAWVLGDVFIRSYCNIYDLQNARIGFAETVKSP